MKRKACVVAGAILLAALQGGAAILQDWQMNDASGTGMAGLANSAGTAAWGYSPGNAATDGNGMLHVSPGSQEWGISAALPSALTTGQYELKYVVDSIDLSGDSATDNSGINFGLGDVTEMRLYSHGDFDGDGNPDLVLSIYDDQTAWSWGRGFSGLVLNDPLTIRGIYDLDAGTIHVYTQLGSEAEQDNGSFNIDTNGTANSVFSRLLTGDWGANDYANIDSVTLTEVVPEPATLGMVGLIGGAIVFVRRRFMI